MLPMEMHLVSMKSTDKYLDTRLLSSTIQCYEVSCSYSSIVQAGGKVKRKEPP